MIAIRVDASGPISRLRAKLEAAQNKEKMLRTIALGLHGVVKTRIHEKGLDANDQPIGTYSPAYMKVRTGQFDNSEVITRGKNKGKTKSAGTYTRGKNKGKARERYNRTNDTKKVVSLTRQTENDFSVQPSQNGYGLGYTNAANLKKMRYQEEREKKKIAKLTPGERKLAVEIGKEFIRGVSE